MNNRFDYTVFNEETKRKQSELLVYFKALADRVEELGPSRSVSLALTNLEECYMWVGKALRDTQLEQSREATKGT